MLPVPDAAERNSSTDYLRDLIRRAGLSQQAAARKIGYSPRSMREWLSGETPAPYAAQFALECLARATQQDTPGTGKLRALLAARDLETELLRERIQELTERLARFEGAPLFNPGPLPADEPLTRDRK